MWLFLYGRRAAGKSTVAAFLSEAGARVYKLSDPLYRIARELFGMQGKDRQLLQVLGDKLREIDPECLLNHLVLRLYAEGPQFAVVEDVRLLREAERLRVAGVPLVMHVGEVDGLPWWEYCVTVEEVRDAG